MAAKTLAQLIEEIAAQYGPYIQLTVTGGSVTTIIDTADLYQPDDYWVGMYAYVLTDAGGAGAAPEGEERAIIDFDQGSSTATVDPAFTTAVASGDTVEFLPLQRATLKRAINAAILAAGETWLVFKSDTSTVTLADDTYTYSLPSDLVSLRSVWYRDDTDEPYKRVDAWRVTKTPGAQELHLDSLDGLDSGDALKLDYLARPSLLTSDSDALGLGEPAETGLLEFIKHYALAWLHELAAGRDGFQEHYTLMAFHYEQATKLQMLAQGRHHGTGTIRPPRWQQGLG